MSESETSKFFKMTKAVPGNVIFFLHSFSNPSIQKTIKLTRRNPAINLPLDWALGVFTDDESYALYKKGVITFEKNNELVKEAYDRGAYFSEELDFEPASENSGKEIFDILQSGNRQKILEIVQKYGNENVKLVAIEHLDELRQGVVSMLEGIFKVQLTMDGGEE